MNPDRLLDEDYWDLVEADPRDWTHDQKILFWWVVTLLAKVGADGVIAAPGQAPMSDEQITDVFNAILPEKGRNERTYLDKMWKYENQVVIFPSADGHIVSIKGGVVTIQHDPHSDSREKFD
jgi:hypothetical protein